MQEYIIEVDPYEVDMPFKGIRLVRCKNCKYVPGNTEGYTCKIRDHFGQFMKDPDNFFCADGKRKD